MNSERRQIVALAAIIEFSKYAIEKDIIDGLVEVFKRKKRYNTESKMLKGVWDYLYYIAGIRNMPFRVDYYSVDKIIKEFNDER